MEITIFATFYGILIALVGYFLRRLVNQNDRDKKVNDERLKKLEGQILTDVMSVTNCRERVHNCSLRISLESINLIMKEVCEKQTQLRIDMPKSYISKEEYKEDITELKMWVKELSGKVDTLLQRRELL